MVQSRAVSRRAPDGCPTTSQARAHESGASVSDGDVRSRGTIPSWRMGRADRTFGSVPPASDVCVWYQATGGLSQEAVRDLERTLSDDEVARGARFCFFQ